MGDCKIRWFCLTRIIQSLYYAPAGRYITSSSDSADRGRSIIWVRFCLEVRIEELKGKIFNFNENNEKSHSVLEYLCIIWLLIVSFAKKNINNLLKKAIDQYIQGTIQVHFVFQVWHNLCSELTSMWTFKMYSRNTKTTNGTDRK